jgi:hypothetical protein
MPRSGACSENRGPQKRKRAGGRGRPSFSPAAGGFLDPAARVQKNKAATITGDGSGLVAQVTRSMRATTQYKSGSSALAVRDHTRPAHSGAWHREPASAVWAAPPPGTLAGWALSPCAQNAQPLSVSAPFSGRHRAFHQLSTGFDIPEEHPVGMPSVTLSWKFSARALCHRDPNT